MPRSASGSAAQSGRRQPAVTSSAAQIASPMNGTWCVYSANRRLPTTLAVIAAARITATIAEIGNSLPNHVTRGMCMSSGSGSLT